VNCIERGTKDFNKALIALFLGSFVTFADLYSTQPVIPIIAEQYGLSLATASLSLSFSTGTMAIGLILVSFFTQNLNRKIVMGVSLSLSALLCLLIGFVDSMPVLLLLRAIQGAALAGYPAIAMAYITEEFNPKSLGYVMGIYLSGNSLGGLSGRLIVGTLSDVVSWTSAIAILGAISCIISLFFWKLIPNSTRAIGFKKDSRLDTMKAFKGSLMQKDLMLLYVLGFLLMGAFVSVYNFIGIPLMQPPYSLSQIVVSLLFIVYLVGTFSSAWMGKLADERQRKNVLLAGVVVMLLGALLTLGTSLWLKTIGLIIFTFCFFGSHSVASSWVGILARKKEKGTASSLYLFSYYTGSSILGALGGVFFHRNGWLGEILMVTLLLLISIGCTLALSKFKQSSSM